MAAKTIKSSNEAERSTPFNAFFEILMITSKTGNTIGKLKIAISVWLFLAFEAIADTIVIVNDNPIEPNSMTRRNKRTSSTGLPNTNA